MSMETASAPAAHRLSVSLAVVLFAQAAGGFFWPALYRDNFWVRSVLVGTDFVTLVLILPLLAGALWLVRRGSPRARLALNGVLYYVFYNNVYYLLSAFNRFFLVYVAVFVLSLGALIASLLATDATALTGPAARVARKPVCAVLAVCAAILALMWTGQAVLFIVKGELPQLIADSGGVTNLVAVLDLTLIVPFLLLGCWWLWQARGWGVIVAAGMLVQCTLITVNLIITPWFQASAGVADAWIMVPLWAMMGAAFLGAALAVFRQVPAVCQN